MTLLGLLVLLVVGAICGALAELIVGWSAGGFFASAGVGFLGALIGGWVARAIGLPSVLAVHIDTVTIDIVWAVLGAVIFLAILSAVRRASYVR
jgi:uncharacterized membrane protein YeaQ/YmgE (transglycosylase-associated protein family)